MLQTSVPVPSTTGPVDVPLASGSSIVFIGANGAGKTRLGVHIEQVLNGHSEVEVQRIAAQRSLGFSDDVQPPSLEIATKRLRYGNDQANSWQKVAYRWAGKPATSMLNDFGHVLGALYAEENSASVAFRHAARIDNATPVPETKLDQLTKIWHTLLPHRRLTVKDATVKTRAADPAASEYAASEMSDGERVIFYLLGQCLLAADDSVVIVDEPELHINRAILGRLWDEIETARPDCAFLYITHDVEFAASRHAATKFALRAYNQVGQGATWDIEPVPDTSDLPDDVLSLIVGSRRPVLFVEGDGGSLDSALYRRVYDGYTVIPVGGCEQVIHTVATFARRTELHRVGCAGLVDFDSRSEDEVADLASGGVHTLPVSEVENLLLLPDVFLALAAAQRFEPVEAQAKLDLLRRSVLDTVRREADNVALRATRRRIDAQVKRIGLAATGIEALDAEFASVVADVRPTELYEEYRAALASAVEAEDYVKVLKLYDNKGLLAEAARYLGMQKRSLEEFVGRALRGKDNEDLLTALTAALPTVTTRP